MGLTESGHDLGGTIRRVEINVWAIGEGDNVLGTGSKMLARCLDVAMWLPHVLANVCHSTLCL